MNSLQIDKKELCPVCGFNVYKSLGEYPWDENVASLEICPSCDIQYGYTDAAGGDPVKREEIYRQWRMDWIHNGMKWGNGKYKDQPRDWDPQKQLNALLEE